MTSFRIFFRDLTPDAQERLLKFFDIESPTEMNWDVFPIVYIEREMDEEAKV